MAALLNDRPDQTTGEKRRIVLIEDNRDARTMLQTLLELRGFEVFAAADGPRGLELVKSERPDVAIVDIELPEFDGFEVARRIRADNSLRGIRLIALTGRGESSDRHRAREAGFDEHISKPMNPPDLLERLNACVPQAETTTTE